MPCASEIERRYAELRGGDGRERPPVAVRSSALGEDSAEASHAGQQESFLWVRGVEQVCDAVRDCWVSLYTPQAISYRAARVGGSAEPAMGVTVQAMVDAEVSGVLFTCSPVSGDPSMVAIDASWGLGVAVVGGELTPDDYLVSKVTRRGGAPNGEHEARRVRARRRRERNGPGRGLRRAADEPCLDGPRLEALVEVARSIERHYGSHQDVEWALARGQELPDALLVLQARPVTTVPERAARADALRIRDVPRPRHVRRGGRGRGATMIGPCP